MKVEITNPITVGAKIKDGSCLAAIMCRIVVTKGAAKLIIGDHVGYRIEATPSGGMHLVQTGPVPVKAKPKAMPKES